jgi:hypothetical protein
MLQKITKLKKIIAPTAAAALLTSPAAAANITILPWYAENGEYTRYWFDWSAGLFQPYAFLNSITLPFTDIIGYWFFVLIWGVYLFGVWSRTQSLAMIAIVMLIGGPLWGMLLPPESYIVGYLCLAMGFTAIIFKLVKR